MSTPHAGQRGRDPRAGELLLEREQPALALDEPGLATEHVGVRSQTREFAARLALEEHARAGAPASGGANLRVIGLGVADGVYEFAEELLLRVKERQSGCSLTATR